MTKNTDEQITICTEIPLDVTFEELESIVSPGVATSPGPVLGGLLR